MPDPLQMDYFTTERINLMSFNNCIARLVSHQQLAAVMHLPHARDDLRKSVRGVAAPFTDVKLWCCSAGLACMSCPRYI